MQLIPLVWRMDILITQASYHWNLVIASVFFFSFPLLSVRLGRCQVQFISQWYLSARKRTICLSLVGFTLRIHACYCMHTNMILSLCHSLIQDWCPNMPEKRTEEDVMTTLFPATQGLKWVMRPFYGTRVFNQENPLYFSNLRTQAVSKELQRSQTMPVYIYIYIYFFLLLDMQTCSKSSICALDSWIGSSINFDIQLRH